LAAVVVPPDQVRKTFATDLNRGGYIVVEVAIYPEARRVVDLSNADFVLRIDSETARPVGASAIAAIVVKQEHKPLQPDDVIVVTSANIGRESVNDPARGGAGAWFIPARCWCRSRQVGGPPHPSATDRARAAIEEELEEKSLPVRARRHLRLQDTYIFRDHAARPKTHQWN
jgi:hypothetical protein